MRWHLYVEDIRCHRDIGWKLLHHMPLYGRTRFIDRLRTASSVLGIVPLARFGRILAQPLRKPLLFIVENYPELIHGQ